MFTFYKSDNVTYLSLHSSAWRFQRVLQHHSADELVSGRAYSSPRPARRLHATQPQRSQSQQCTRQDIASVLSLPGVAEL